MPGRNNIKNKLGAGRDDTLNEGEIIVPSVDEVIGYPQGKQGTHGVIRRVSATLLVPFSPSPNQFLSFPITQKNTHHQPRQITLLSVVVGTD